MKRENEKIPASPVRNWLGFLLRMQIHSSQYAEFVFACYGGLEEIRLIKVRLGPALAGGANPHRILLFESPGPYQLKNPPLDGVGLEEIRLIEVRLGQALAGGALPHRI